MKRRDGFLERRIGGMHLIIPLTEGRLLPDNMVSVNSTGVFLWDKLKDDQTEDSLAALLADEYGIDRETACSDIKAFLDRAMEAGLLELK